MSWVTWSFRQVSFWYYLYYMLAEDLQQEWIIETIVCAPCHTVTPNTNMAHCYPGHTVTHCTLSAITLSHMEEKEKIYIVLDYCKYGYQLFYSFSPLHQQQEILLAKKES